ncbi:MAG: amidohydrolase family protein [Chloroflexi bacterium]|nr:amidohydrolase family protein [Chloroflexota bacterium]
MKIVLAHLGHPYEVECAAIIRKHPNFFVDISALYYGPFQFYQSLMLGQKYGVWDKLLFGTDNPFTKVDSAIAGLRWMHAMLDGTALLRLDISAIEAMIHCDVPGLLGLKGPW